LGARSFTPSLVHDDLHLDNIRVTPDNKIFLIDFDGAFWGDALYDFAEFKYFHPKLYTKLRKLYSSNIFKNEKAAMELYSFHRALDLAAFFASKGKLAKAKKAISTAAVI